MHSNNSNTATNGVGGGMGTLEGRTPTGATTAASGRYAGFGSAEAQPVASSKMMQTQKLQNNFFFQPSSPRDSADILHMTQAADASSNPNLASAAQFQQQHRNIRTAAGGPRQRMLSQSNAQKQSGYYAQGHHLNLQIQTASASPTNNALILAPHHLGISPGGPKHAVYPQTTDHHHTAAVGKSFDFNKYRKEHGTATGAQTAASNGKQQLMPNMMITPNAGPGSTGAPGGYGSPTGSGVHQHPESAFFKPKINAVADRGQMAPTSSQRGNRIGTQRHPQGTLSPKGAPPNGQRGAENLPANGTNGNSGSPQHIWTSKKRPTGAPPFKDANQ